MLLSASITKLSFSNFRGQQEARQNLICSARAISGGHTMRENARVRSSEIIIAFSEKS